MDPSRPLTERQTQIVRCAAEGLTDKEISRMIGISEGTLRTYWGRLRTRFDARSRTEVIAKALVEKAPLPDLALYLAQKMPLFIWTTLPNGYVDFCNEWFETCGDLDAEEVLGVGCRALMLPEDLAASRTRWREAQRTEQPYEALVNFRCGPEKRIVLHKIRLTPIKNGEGRLVKWIGYGRELAENADEQMVSFLKGILAPTSLREAI